MGANHEHVLLNCSDEARLRGANVDVRLLRILNTAFPAACVVVRRLFGHISFTRAF